MIMLMVLTILPCALKREKIVNFWEGKLWKKVARRNTEKAWRATEIM
jgi:hypothetical protein